MNTLIRHYFGCILQGKESNVSWGISNNNHHIESKGVKKGNYNNGDYDYDYLEAVFCHSYCVLNALLLLILVNSANDSQC